MFKSLFLMMALIFPANLSAADINYSAICKVVASTPQQTQGGTGFVYNEDKDNYYIMTNGHVIEGMDKTYVSFYKDSYVSNLIDTKLAAKRFQPNTTKDVAVLLLDKKKAPFEVTPLQLYDVDKNGALKIGDEVIGAGYPDGYWLQSWEARLSRRKIQNVPSLTTLTMGPVGGQSGSPVMIEVDGKNYVVGMVTFRFGVGIKPTESFGGYINLDYIKAVLNNKSDHVDVMPAKVEYHVNPENRRLSPYIQTVSTQTQTQYFVLVDSKNLIIDYYILPNGEKVPKFYTREEFGNARLRPGDSFFPAEHHPACRDGKLKRWLHRMRDGFPSIEMHPPAEPFINKDLPPFNKPTVPPTEKLSLWPEGSPFDKKEDDKKPETKESPKEAPKDTQKQPEKPVEAPKPDPRIAELEAKLKHAQDEQKRLNDDTLAAQRKVWAEKEAALLAELEKAKKEPAEQPQEPEKKGFFGRVFGKISDVAGNTISSISGMIGFSEEGTVLSILGLVVPFLIPGVREFAIAKGVSPTLIKGAEYAARFGKYLISKKKGTDKLNGEDELPPISSIVDDVDDIPISPVVTTPVVVTQPVQEEKPAESEKSQNSEENTPNSPEPENEDDYNNAEFNRIVNETQDSNTTIPQNIKEYIDLRITHGEKLQEMVLVGHLYEEAVMRLGKGELTDDNGGPLVGHERIHKAITKWVRDEYIRKIPYQTSMSTDAVSYLTAYRGWLYQQAVTMLEKGDFPVLNHTTAARVIQEWVQKAYYEKITRII